MKLTLMLPAFLALTASASALDPLTPAADTSPNTPSLAKRNWPSFVEHLRGPCHENCGLEYAHCKKVLCPVNKWGCSKVCYMELCNIRPEICKGCHYC